VDLTRGVLNIESLQSILFGNSLGVYSTEYGFGTDTNFDWNPGFDLTATTAYSSWPAYIDLTNSRPYFYFNFPATNLVVIRAVFVQDTSVNIITNRVYIEPDLAGSSVVFAPGAAHVEWVGAVNDPTTCGTVTNYLYLTDDYVLGASTNVMMANGTPDNFTFVTSTTPLLTGPVTPGFYNEFPFNAITNPYAFFYGELISTTAPTNVTPLNPSGAITNMPGRIQITASNELNLNLVSISGQNYLSLLGTNQFDGSVGARIAAAYSDIRLGVTNGFLTITNLLMSAIPNWSGNVEAWSTRWLTGVSNTVDGTNYFIVTNDYRVLIVGSSQLTPVTAPQVQNLSLHATNSLVITDVLNVFGSLFMDAQNLTLTTNGCGNGATSLEGELNLISTAILWQSALPNVQNLTNNGAIRTHNLAQFICTSLPAVAATGTVSEVLSSGNVAANNQVTIGTYKYTFVNTVTNTVANQIKIAPTFDGSLSNLIAAINHAGGSGTNYSTNTVANKYVLAGGLMNHGFTVMAVTNGTSGNSIVTTNSTATTNLTWNGHATLYGGANAISGATLPYNNFINRGLISDQGSTIYANNFLSGGIISNGVGSFLLQSQSATLTNGSLIAAGDVSITASSLVTSNLLLQAGRALTLKVTNFITDNGVTNGNTWSVGGSAVGGSDSGFNLLLLPNSTNRSDLLGTTVTDLAPPNKSITNIWAGRDYGVSAAGYTNNMAIGRLILDSLTNAPYSQLNFRGTGVSNAIYVDELVLLDYASYTNIDLNGDLPALGISSNLVIYYGQALSSGGPGGSLFSAAEYLNNHNNGHLRWVATYAGYYSGTNIVYPDGTTNGPFNTALAQSPDIDSDGDGIVNGSDPTPFFVSTNFNLTVTVTNLPPLSVRVQWTTIPLATNYIYYATNMFSTNWLPFTNFGYYYYGANVAVPNTAGTNSFISPQPRPSPATNVWVYDVVTNVSHYYRVMVNPWLTWPY
jgi:hypothetical protein